MGPMEARLGPECSCFCQVLGVVQGSGQSRLLIPKTASRAQGVIIEVTSFHRLFRTWPPGPSGDSGSRTAREQVLIEDSP